MADFFESAWDVAAPSDYTSLQDHNYPHLPAGETGICITRNSNPQWLISGIDNVPPPLLPVNRPNLSKMKRQNTNPHKRPPIIIVNAFPQDETSTYSDKTGNSDPTFKDSTMSGVDTVRCGGYLTPPATASFLSSQHIPAFNQFDIPEIIASDVVYVALVSKY
jgi:hypothetical protein